MKTAVIFAILLCSQALYAQNIVQVEYYIDTDPGFGNGTQVSIATPAPDLDLNFNVGLSDVSSGLHVLFVRARDDSSKWSLTYTSPFLKKRLDVAPNVTKAEYYIDTDPGFGAGVDIPITAGIDITKDFVVDLSGTGDGLHVLFVRARDDSSRWSLSYTSPFLKKRLDIAPNVTKVEYYIDNDPGFGNGVDISIAAGVDITKDFVVNLSGVSDGLHVLFVRVRDVQPGHRAYIEAAQLRAGLEAEKDPRRLITDYLSQGIETGAVSDRATMVSALQRAGLEVPRQGEHYLTAADPEGGGKWRLKGAIYERDFQRERLTSAAPEEGRAGPARNRSTDSERAEEARKKLEAERERRDVYHRARYQGSHPVDERGAVATVAAERGGRGVSLSRHLGRELGPDTVVCQPNPEPHRGAGGARVRDPRDAPDHRADRARHVGRETRRGQRAALRDPAGEHPRKSALDHGRTAYRQDIERVKELYDRVRTAVDERLNRAVEAVRSGDGAAGRVGRRIAGAGAAARRIGQGLEAAARADRSVGQGFEAASRDLGSELQGDRRSIARGLNAIWKKQQQARERQRGPERDFGPSR